MKSVVALLVLVAVCYAQTVANFPKDGGLKGSWYDELPFTTVLDNLAPTVSYDTSTTSFLLNSWTGLNLTNHAWDGAYDDVDDFFTDYTNSAYFTLGGIDDYENWYTMGGAVALTWWTGTSADTATTSIDASCTTFSDFSVTCTWTHSPRVGSGTFKPLITTMDQFSNMATYTETAFTNTATYGPSTYTVVDNRVDFTGPVVSAGTVSVTTLTVGSTSNIYTSQQALISVTVDDMVTETTGEDPLATGVMGVWVFITDNDGVESSYMMNYFSSSATTSAKVYQVYINFPSYAPTGTYTVERIDAYDFAGNMGTLPVDDTIVVSWDSSNNDDATSCQTLDLIDVTPDWDVSTTWGYAYVSVLLTCTEKYTGTNYAYVSYQSPAYIAQGDTLKSSVVTMGNSNDGLSPVLAGSVSDSTYFTYWTPGTPLTSGVATFEIDVYPGNAGIAIGSWTLYEVITVTDSGVAQRYTSELGAASSVVPSVFAVAIAALFALLRL